MSKLTDLLRGKRIDGMMHTHMQDAANEIDRLTLELETLHAMHNEYVAAQEAKDRQLHLKKTSAKQ